MATTYFDAEDFYNLKSEVNIVKINVQTGDGPSGGFLIFNGSHLIGLNSEAIIKKEEIINDWITIAVVIKDKPELMGWASVVVTLTEDAQIPKTFGAYRRKIEGSVDTVCYTIKINIVR